MTFSIASVNCCAADADGNVGISRLMRAVTNNRAEILLIFVPPKIVSDKKQWDK
jgi:hypothetical protein